MRGNDGNSKDCRQDKLALFGYALAMVRGLPLLYKGNDFAQTDVLGALRTMQVIPPAAGSS